ncbi:MAG: hypothetical protein ACD_60C00041G0010 [uncultured bacterium]|nr:MAG: hypothetical protein ACD_60C00041G0010 [uncultured bacterium]
MSIKNALLILLVALSGCTYIYGNKGVIQNRDTDYLKARSIPPLQIPPGLSSSTVEASFPVPDRDYPGSNQPISIIPPELNTSGK